MKNSAFTIIELLVVIVIIALLAALIFPVFASAREKARQTVCQSNEKQIGFALLQYVRDYDECFPPRQDETTLISWRVMVQPYLKNAEIFRCPSNSNGSLPTSSNPETSNDPVGISVSYAINTNDANSVGGICNNRLGKVVLAEVVDTAQVIGIAEITAYYSDFNVTVRPGAFTSENNSGWNGHLFSGHNGFSNFWFTDGHVKAMKPLSTLNSKTEAVLIAAPSPCLWTLDNSSLTSTSSSTGYGNDYENAFTILNYSQNLSH